jgi:AmmeMemoRadiSam system radical SAM enzyme/AmmeMemoRadiSam system protein B/AmmeMemoRadiSam system protein A
MSQVVTLPPDTGLFADGTKAGGWWHDAGEPGRMICDLCPRACNLKPGDRGFCFVRQNRDGQMVLTTYGRSTGFCIDPIEKKPLNHFYPGTSVLSFGTAGCNLGCKFCQNHDISKAREVELLSECALPEAIARAAAELGCLSVAYTYNDPVIWAEYAIDTARACREAGIKSVAVTAGYITPLARQPFFEYFDAANVDLKGFTEQFYQHLTLSHLQPVLDTLEWLKRETDVWFEITNLVIPQANDDLGEIRQMCDWILEHVGDEVPLHFTAFHPDYRMLDRPPTPRESLLAAYDVAKRCGVKFVYIGNVDDEEHQSTYCPACGKRVIQRNWYELGAYDMKRDRCGHCGFLIPGHFATQPGTWGRRRLPIQIARFADSTPRPVAEAPACHTKGGCGNSLIGSPVSGSADCWEELSDEQNRAIHEAASEIVSAAIQQRPPQIEDADLAGAAGRQVLGCYISLKRDGRLRSCCGLIGPPIDFRSALYTAGRRTATEDVRLPPISVAELSYLELETWLLFGLAPIPATGAEREAHVIVGKHGLKISRGQSAGLLLPGVATEFKLDADGFLRHVCLKAGLPPTAWRDSDVELMTFEGRSYRGPVSPAALQRGAVNPPPYCSASELAGLREFTADNVTRILQGATPNYYHPYGPDGMVHGAILAVSVGERSPGAHVWRLSLRPAIPLQATLFQLAESLAVALRRSGLADPLLPAEGAQLAILHDPAMHGTVARPDLRGVRTDRRAIFVTYRRRAACLFDSRAQPEGLLQAALEAAQLEEVPETAIYSLEVESTAVSVRAVRIPRAVRGGEVRAPAVAGTFYPGSADELRRTVAWLLPSPSPARATWRAALVPHAGYVYSGRIAGDVLSRIEFPPTVVVIGPKHTPHGVDWAVAPQRTWSLPGMDIPSDTRLARRLASGVPGWELDTLAHRDEHGIEVELPFIHQLAPEVRVVGVALASATWKQCQEFAGGLVGVLADWGEPVLLVISSDMNHYATDAENRRLDEIALQAIETLDPQHVYDTVRGHDISMCGLIPCVVVLEALRRIQPWQRAHRVAYATSADVSGDRSRVVGYAGMLFE